MNSRNRGYKTLTCNLLIPNSQKIPGPKNRDLRGFTVIQLILTISSMIIAGTQCEINIDE